MYSVEFQKIREIGWKACKLGGLEFSEIGKPLVGSEPKDE